MQFPFSFGFSSFLFAALDPSELRPDPAALPIARVTDGSRGHFLVATAAGERRAVLSGRARDAGAEPVPGDWVVVEEVAGTLRVLRRLDRATAFERRDATGHRQVVAANVDEVWLAVALDQPLSPRRVQRYLAAVHAAGAEPLIVFTKAEAFPREPAERIVAAVGDTPRVYTSAVSGEGVADLVARLAPSDGVARTGALVGISGAGKSSLVNAIFGEEVQRVHFVRGGDRKGWHTTTARRLLLLPNGGLLLDTPGMRGFLLADDAGADEAWADVTAFAQDCRYRDCTHSAEPGCAVVAAVEAGTLDAYLVQGWRNAMRQAAYQARREDPELERANRERWKRIHKAHRARDAARERERG